MNYFFKKYLYFLIIIFWASLNYFAKSSEYNNEKAQIKTINNSSNNLNWRIYKRQYQENKKIEWKLLEDNDFKNKPSLFDQNDIKDWTRFKIGILNRSIIFNDKEVGPDISWILPPGFSWNKKYKFDFSARGHNTKIPEPENRNFFGWNDGDAVGLFSYQFLHNLKSSFGINLGIRSVYQGNKHIGGSTNFGDGVSAGFRWDFALSPTSGIAFGAEQLIHFDNKTDTGRNLYLTTSKAWWSDKYNGQEIFPLNIATAGIATGRMAVGTIKGFCSNSLGGSGTETKVARDLCWAPVFSLARVWNPKYSTFFEYNSRFFLLGSSYAPFKEIPLRGTFALILSDHVDNYKLHDFSELNWVFNISLGL